MKNILNVIIPRAYRIVIAIACLNVLQMNGAESGLDQRLNELAESADDKELNFSQVEEKYLALLQSHHSPE